MTKNKRKRWLLREWRKARSLTQDQLAEITGLSKAYISQLECGQRKYNQDLLELFALHLRCTPAELLEVPPELQDGILYIYSSLKIEDKAKLVSIAKTLLG